MRLRTLEQTELVNDAGAPILTAGKPFALLAYLAAAPARSASRNKLVSLLWADVEPDAARHALRQTLWYLRQKAGRELVVPNAEVLTLVPDVSSDRDDLLEASRVGDHERVVTLYTGAFIPHFAAPGGAGFEEWCMLERRRLLESFRNSLESIVVLRLSQGRARDAIELARRVRDQDVYNESGWRLLIETCMSAGDVLGAKTEAEALQELADRDDLELEPPTRAAVRAARLLNAGTKGENGGEHPAAGFEPSLVGRETAFASLLTAWDAATSGVATRIHLTARAGIGKSRLLRDFAFRLRGLRAKVVTVRGALGTRDVPYALASDLAAALATLPGKRALSSESAATLVGLNPALSTYFDNAPRHLADTDALRARTLAMRELIHAVSFEHAVAILGDDLHWWDDASIALVAALVDGLQGTKVLFMTAGRPEVRHVPLVSGDATRHVFLNPLTAAHTEELVLSIATLPAADWATSFAGELWRATRGSPLLALEMLQLLEDRELLRRESGVWATDRPDALGAELTAGDVLRSRLQDMDRLDRWLLTILCVVGAPVDRATLVEASQRSESEVAERVHGLEGRGFVTRELEGWRIAHDELADEVLRLAGDEATARARTQSARALAASMPFSASRARRAAQLLRTIDDVGAGGDLLRRYAAYRFSIGDRRTVRALARDLFGHDLRPPELETLERAIPTTWRLGLTSRPRRFAAAVATIILLSSTSWGLTMRTASPRPDAALGIALVDSVGTVTFHRVDLREDGWSPREPLRSKPWRGIAPFRLSTPSTFFATWDTARELLYTIEAVDDEGTIDIVARDRRGTPRRVAPARGDDAYPRLSPDGARLVFETGRWNPHSRYDIALHSFADGSTIQLTSGDASDQMPVFSPDGTRIAFARNNWGERANEICVLMLPAGEPECHALVDGHAQLVGWLTRDRLLFLLKGQAVRSLRVTDWSTHESESLLDDVTSASLSPDGRWVLCECATTAHGEIGPVVFPIHAPSLRRALVLPARMDSPSHPFWILSSEALAAERVRVDTTIRLAPVGVPLQLDAAAVDDRGRSITHLGSIRWRVIPEGGASIDSVTGVVIATGRVPSIIAIASMGATARDSVRLDVSRDSARLAFEELWPDTTLSGWVSFGKPMPRVVTTTAGNAFLNNGDGSFSSGAISERVFDARRGLALEATISTLVTRPQWQHLGLALVRSLDTTWFAGARDRNPTPVRPIEEVCAFALPGEQQFARERAVSFQSSRAYSIPPPPGWLDGSWHRVRVQLLPDGRCGFAMGGRPMAILPRKGVALTDVRVLIQGSSAETQMLVGLLRVYEGVPSDVDWTVARVIR